MVHGSAETIRLSGVFPGFPGFQTRHGASLQASPASPHLCTPAPLHFCSNCA
ncbi:hypothetical protein MC7420_7346 [Coleofasciculus chthonoplastes PCC 7420]|uniref:Uncharacterized protein n=1 Tax=Coleofasciculus chthonoplastes PCC 7420 TaxID=118168 RepID=B4VHY8_9CYAN|nr:hypothetical protein MC7420_7346 [Coleofasciculus chthonoplastes PCC 7420]